MKKILIVGAGFSGVGRCEYSRTYWEVFDSSSR